jgi:hypothetical protein
MSSRASRTCENSHHASLKSYSDLGCLGLYKREGITIGTIVWPKCSALKGANFAISLCHASLSIAPSLSETCACPSYGAIAV